MPLPKFRWGILIPSVLGGLLILGIIRDVGKTYWERRSIENAVWAVARDAAKFLPYRRQEAVQAVLQGLRDRGIEPSGDSAEVAEDGRSITVTARSSTTAWFAWLVGRPELHFKARSTARIEVEGGGPVGAVTAKDVLFAAAASNFLTPGASVAFTPAAGPAEAGAQLHAYRLEFGGEVLAVGDVVRLGPLPAEIRDEIARRVVLDRGVTLAQITENSPRLPRIAVVEAAPAADTGTVVGFAAFFLADPDAADTKVRGVLAERLLEPDPAAPGPRQGAPRDYGLRRAGVVRVL